MSAHQLMMADPGGDDSAADVVPAGLTVEVRRSARRRRTITAYREDGRTVVLIPARLSKAEERRVVDEMVAKLAARDAKLRPSDDELAARAARLSDTYLQGRAQFRSVRWASNQRHRWGSCTVQDASIRLSTRLRGMPEYVIDYVLLHELAHLIEPTHGPRFHELLQPYPQAERAQGYLDGITAAHDEGLGRSASSA